jgi:SecD/SecF fusion protein
MKQNNLGRFILVLVIIAWSLYQVYPPTSRSLLSEFSNRALGQDASFKAIVEQAIYLQKAGTNEFAALQQAIGTNDVQKYFTFINAKTQVRPNTYILNRLQREASGKIKLGLDLQGGTSFLVEMDTNALLAASSSNSVQPVSELTSSALNQAIEVLRKRIDQFGVAEPVIQSAGGNRILVQLPGLSQADKDRAKEQISKAAFLEFRMVHPDSQNIVNEATGEIIKAVPPGYVLLKHVELQADGKTTMEAIVVKNKAENGLSGDIVKHAKVDYGNLGQPQIDFELTADGAKRFGEVTSANIDHRLAIVLDGELYSAPNIQSAILGGNGQITGRYTIDAAKGLANVLQNPLRAPLKIVFSRDVSPTLGKDSIKSGIQASIYGVVFVSVFMLGYYLLAGLAANVALVTNIIILLGVMCSVGTTFTLPGIAGAVLTVGMAVDANVLIYERIREELAKGKSLRGSIDAGYARAFGTIFDSHVTTLISSIILIFMGTGEIKGFGVTLTIGVAASLFTALVVTRLIFNFLVDRNLIKSLTMLHIIPSTAKIDFMKMAKPLFVLTWVFAIAALGFGIFNASQGKRLFGVDFVGGDSTSFTFAQKLDEKEIRTQLALVGESAALIQYQRDVVGNSETLSITTSSGSADKVKNILAEKLPAAKYVAIGGFNVGAAIGKEIQRSAVVASLLALLGILLYVAFRYEFSFAVAAVVAVLHDVLFTIGAYCVANAISGREFNATVVAAVLTIIGFSINDKIVIFDRIREQLKLGVRGSFKDIINLSLNQTLSRTIITSGTVFLATMSLFIFGGGEINDFAFTFLVGIIVGTYSSIYIASVIVLRWHKGERPEIGASQVTVQGGSPAPSAKV